MNDSVTLQSVRRDSSAQCANRTLVDRNLDTVLFRTAPTRVVALVKVHVHGYHDKERERIYGALLINSRLHLKYCW